HLSGSAFPQTTPGVPPILLREKDLLPAGGRGSIPASAVERRGSPETAPRRDAPLELSQSLLPRAARIRAGGDVCRQRRRAKESGSGARHLPDLRRQANGKERPAAQHRAS